ncbi:MAG: hypothetical protein P0Y53_19505 [Candidatus Pseudobacter hemicellulosilyticus]|uniref:Uncharacterized protein n=1 Tax=Candidatus Pseudobacter hemicellulosilyticus TaxID=3121375 RepID=A0AAJ5WS42_9BACT|nr:MAG: hypothetical protein P0Y53_19505 [Pseudobacter sp.]
MEPRKPAGFEDSLSSFGAVIFDSYCGEPVAWGFKLTNYLGEDLFNELGKHGRIVCVDGYKSVWALVIKTLSREEAATLYGEITNEEIGPRGGWKSTTFGQKTFVNPYLRPEKKLD